MIHGAKVWNCEAAKKKLPLDPPRCAFAQVHLGKTLLLNNGQNTRNQTDKTWKHCATQPHNQDKRKKTYTTQRTWMTANNETRARTERGEESRQVHDRAKRSVQRWRDRLGEGGYRKRLNIRKCSHHENNAALGKAHFPEWRRARRSTCSKEDSTEGATYGGLLSCWRQTAGNVAPSRRGSNHGKMV